MEAVAKLRNIPTSPRKMRLVADMIRGVRVEKALGILKLEPKHNSYFLEKLLLSAISNWENKNESQSVEDASLVVKSIQVDGGRILKRLRPAPQGRAHRIRKRSNHVTIVVDSLTTAEVVKKAKTVKEQAPKAESKTATKSSKAPKKTDK